MSRPPCFSSDEQFEDYMEYLEKSAPKNATYCWDCTKQYQREMMEEGLCRHPETEFVLTRIKWDSGVQGVR